MDNAIINKLKKEIENFSHEAKLETSGVVTRAADGIAEIEGLDSAVMSEMIRFEVGGKKELKDELGANADIFGVILNLEEDSVKAIILGDSARIYEGMEVVATGKVLSIPVSEDIVGRVVSPLGEILDGGAALTNTKQMAIERESYGVMDRQSVNTPLHTGIKAIDSMIPIGRGQRELIIGDRYTGKTSIAIDTILNQLSEPTETRPICIYVAVGQKESKTARIVGELKEKGAMAYTIVVDAGASSPAAFQYLAPFAGAAIGEFFMDQGRDALVIYDDLSKHAVAYRQLSLLLRRPPGREAYPGDVFYLHSRLLERAARLSKEKGGGSLTALPIIETQENDISAYIPTNVISITDGQIFLETDLFNKGSRPAINVGNSVSRVGSSAQTKAMKKVSGKIKLDLAQFRELEAFMQFAQDLDADTKSRIDSGQRLTMTLRQRNGRPMSFASQAVTIYAAVNGYLAKVSPENVPHFEEKFLAHLESEDASILGAIMDSKELSADTEEKLKSALTRFIDTHPELATI